jgi:hypothetical protein
MPAHQQAVALGGRPAAPALRGALGSGDRCARLDRTQGRHGRDLRARRGIDDRDALAVLCLDPASVHVGPLDEQRAVTKAGSRGHARLLACLTGRPAVDLRRRNLSDEA